MPVEVQKWTKSVREVNPGFKYHLWTERQVFLSGFNLDELKGKYGSWAGVSNFLRLHVIHQFGGIFCDTDILALKPFDDLLNYNAFAAFQDQIDGGRLCNAAFGAAPGHPWIKWQIDNADTELNSDAASGPYCMTKAPRGDLEIVPTDWLYPWHYDAPRDQRVPKPDSFMAHYWVGSWVKK